MIRHQDIGVKPAPIFDRCLSKTSQEETVITGGEKLRMAIVSARRNYAATRAVMNLRRRGRQIVK
jgi:hypothetical protein